MFFISKSSAQTHLCMKFDLISNIHRFLQRTPSIFLHAVKTNKQTNKPASGHLSGLVLSWCPM